VVGFDDRPFVKAGAVEKVIVNLFELRLLTLLLAPNAMLFAKSGLRLPPLSQPQRSVD